MPLTLKHTEAGTMAMLSGEFTIGTLKDLKPSLLELLQHPKLVLNLSQVSDFDGSGLQLLKIVLTEAERRKQPIGLEQVSQQMRDCMQLLGFDAAISLPEEAQHGSH